MQTHSTDTAPHRASYFWVVALLLLTTALAAAHLAHDVIWFDEWITYFITGSGNLADRSLGSMLSITAQDNSWPPLFFLLLWAWDALAGGSVVADRVLALWFGVLSVAVVYQLGRTLIDERTGLIAATLLASNAFLLHYMHEIRGYTAYVFFSALAAWFYWLIRQRVHRRWLRWAFPLSIAGVLYAHYIGIAVVAGIFFYHVLFERPDYVLQKRRIIASDRWARVLRLWFNGCLLYTPWIAVLLVSLINESLTDRDVSPFSLFDSLLYGFSNNLLWIAVPALLVAVIGWRTKSIQFLWVWVLTVIGVSLLGNLYADFLFHPRHMMGLLPAFVLLIAFGIAQTRRLTPTLPLLLIGIWLGAGMIYSAQPTFMNAIPRHVSTIPRASMDAMLALNSECIAGGDLRIVAIDEPADEWIHDLPLEYYLGSANLTQLGLLVTDEADAVSRLLPQNLRDEAPFERVAASATERIWLMTLPDLPVQQEILALQEILLAQGYSPCAIRDNANLFATVYGSFNGESCAEVQESCTGMPAARP